MSVSHEIGIVPDRGRSTLVELPSAESNEYWAHVDHRETLRDTETTRTGATIYSELVTLNDSLGRKTVRELTIAVPNSNLVEVSPYAWVETDPWTTGSEGLNRDKIKRYADIGFTVVWLHHGGRYSPVGKDKSISRSAHQVHSVLDDIGGTIDANIKEVLAGGYSRGAMTEEKFDSMAPEYGRTVMFSDTTAPCFVRDMTKLEKVETLVRQLPSEALGVGKLTLKVVERAIQEQDPGLLLEYAKTPDLHIQNVFNEVLWAKALINSNVNHAINSLSPDTVGVRTFYTGDIMSQQSDYQELYSAYPGIAVLTEEGPHVAGAYPENLEKQYSRMQKVQDYIQDHSGSILGIQPEHVLPPSVSVSKPALWLHTEQAS